jgi:hypothetical protein
LYSVGKKRFESDRTLDAIAPILLSLKLFANLSIAPESLATLKISSRFHFLATLYKGLDLVDESVLSLILALRFDVMEASQIQSDDDPQVRLGSSLLSCTMDVVCKGSSEDRPSSMSGQRIGLVAMLMHMRTRMSSSCSTGDGSALSKLTLCQALDQLLESVLPVEMNGFLEPIEPRRDADAMNLGVALDVMFGSDDAMTQAQQSNPEMFLSEKAIVEVDLMVKMGQELQQQYTEVSNDEKTTTLSEFEAVCAKAQETICQMETNDLNSINIIRALLFTAASVCLISCHSYLDFDRWCTQFCDSSQRFDAVDPCFRLAVKYAGLAVSVLDEPTSSSRRWGHFATSLRASLKLFYFQLSCMNQPSRVSHDFDLNAIKVLVDSLDLANAVSPELASLSRRCTMTLLSRLCGLFALKGEDLCAVQVAKWNFDATRTEPIDPQSWFKANVFSRLTSDSVAAGFVLGSESTVSGSPEERACALRLAVRDSIDDVGTIQDQFALLLKNLDGSCDVDSSVMTSLRRWTRTTVLLGLSECAERSGALEMALRIRQECFAECRNISSMHRRTRRSKKKEKSSLPFWTHVAFSSLATRCTERQVDCLQGVALLYSQLGDHRKAADYAMLALVPEVKEFTGLTAKSSFSEILCMLRNVPPENCQDIRSRRFLLRLKSKASPLDLVSLAFQNNNNGLSSGKFSVEPSLNGRLEEIKDLYESECAAAVLLCSSIYVVSPFKLSSRRHAQWVPVDIFSSR